jgi:hypothetical protein
VTFNSTVTQEHVDQWVILFCVNWWDRCQGVIEDYKSMARQWEYELAGDASSWLSTAVRFGEVNCATDKPLCNENNVDNYPTAQHFINGKLASQWVPSSNSVSLSHDIAIWVQQELTKTSRPDATGKRISSSSIFADVPSMWANGMRELSALLSWRNPLACLRLHRIGVHSFSFGVYCYDGAGSQAHGADYGICAWRKKQGQISLSLSRVA